MANTVYMRSHSGEIFTTGHPEYHKDCETISKAEGVRLYREQACSTLRRWLKPGDTVYTSVRSVARSGMSRTLRVYIVRDGRIADITYTVSVATKKTMRDGCIVMNGCGMDMGFALVYDMGYQMWPAGTAEPHGTRNGAPDSCGGYALKHEWL